MRKFGLMALALPVFLVGCGDSDPTSPDTADPDGGTQVWEIDTPNGRYQCISWAWGHAGGVSCDALR